jgi:serine/threonine protein kinase
MGTNLAFNSGPHSARFQVLRRLGASATTEVVLAIERGPGGFERPVVLKRLIAGRATRITREAMAYARLTHPAITRLYTFIEDEGRLTLVLEHVDGPSLARVISMLHARGERLDDDAALLVGYRLFGALAAAHDARDPLTREFTPIVHRDVSPANVVIAWDGHVKLLDFGVARLGASTETHPGDIVGTMGYLAPEQVRGEAPTVRTDVYAAALVVRELLTGERAFDVGGHGEVQRLAAMASPSLAPLSDIRPDLPARVLEVLDSALATDAERRGVTAEEIAAIVRSAIDVEIARRLLVARISTLRLDDEALSRRALVLAPHATDETLTAPGLREVPAAETSRPPPPESLVVRVPPPAPIPFIAMPGPFVPELGPLLEPDHAHAPPPSTARSASPRPHRRVLAVFAVGATLTGAVIGGAMAHRDRDGARDTVRDVPAGAEAAEEAMDAAEAPAASAAVAAPAPASVAASAAVAAHADPTAPADAPAPAEASASAEAPTLPSALSGTGLILTDPGDTGHRLYFDGHYLAGAGTAITAPCGRHHVRVGSRGRAQVVVVPCGGSVRVTR